MIIKITAPTTILPEVTNSPKDVTTSPGSPVDKINRVEETFNPNRNKVVTNNNVGKIAKSKTLFEKTAINKIKTENAIFKANKISNKKEGRGIIIRITIIKINPATIASLYLCIFFKKG